MSAEPQGQQSGPTPLAQGEPEVSDAAIVRLLGQRCVGCHNSSDLKGGLDLSTGKTAFAGGDSGAAILPGNTTESLLWTRVNDGEMPPDHPLTDEEMNTVERWIRGGARYPVELIDPFQYSSNDRAGYDWWSLQPIVRPTVPQVDKSDWSKSPIDDFVLARLRERDLSPSEEADRRTLIRRVTFDLVGLPPTPEQIDQFLADDSPDAYGHLVDRLLDSPHYGERWARLWLDLARFGESQGFERDKLRPHAWRYRDWVVDALNRDMPYDEFVRRQIAGDVLHPKNSSATVATGFLVAGAYDEVGQNQQSEAMRAVVRQDELEDLISVVGQTFLGLTVNCARCHDHKFDPVSQKEYYRLAAALAGVRQGMRDIKSPDVANKIPRQVAVIQARLDQVIQELALLEEPARRSVLADRSHSSGKKIAVPEPIANWEFNGDLKDSIGEHHGTAYGDVRFKNGGVYVTGKASYVATNRINQDITAKTLEAWVRLDHLNQAGGGVICLNSMEAPIFDAIVFGEMEPRRWTAGSNGFQRTKKLNVREESQADRQLVHMAVAYDADGTVRMYRNGRPYGKPYQTDGPVRYKSDKAMILFGLRHLPPAGNRFLNGTIDRARLYDTALSDEQIYWSAGEQREEVSEQQLLAQLSAREIERREQLRFEHDQLLEHKTRAMTQQSYAVISNEPEPTYVLNRGNPADKGQLVTAGGVAALTGISAEFGLQPDTDDSARRVALARWITDRSNPLFARVIVNRLWQYHFGVGFVETPSDLGFSGGQPTHPNLLDWLATELAQNNWSLKSLHRAIVTSATYRQASVSRDDGAQIDAQNRYLWRKSPRRLEAETVRDSLLFVAGKLNTAIGGPGFYDFTTSTRNAQFYFPNESVGETFNRRSLYRTWVRSGRNGFLDVFDCPDPSTKSPKRVVTTTPLQALALMNNALVLRMSQRFQERLEREVGTSLESQINRAYRLAYGRLPQPDELQVTKDFADHHGLAALCRVIFNSNEFLYVD